EVEKSCVRAELVFRVPGGPGHVAQVFLRLAPVFGGLGRHLAVIGLDRVRHNIPTGSEKRTDDQRVRLVGPAQAGRGRDRQQRATVHVHSIRSSGMSARTSVMSMSPTGCPPMSITGSSLIRCCESTAIASASGASQEMLLGANVIT